MTRISEYKLSQPFEEFDTLEIDYVQDALAIAKRIVAMEEVTPEEIRHIRLDATNDRDHLKGDFVISMFTGLLKKGYKFERWEKGKSMRASEELITSVIEHYYKEESSVTSFCKENRLDRGKYYRILNATVSNPDKKKLILEIKERVAEKYKK